MNKNTPFCVFLYGGSLFMFLNTSQWFLLWLMMEMSTITFLSFFFFEKTKSENVTLYFLIQSVASFFILFSLVSNEMSGEWSMMFDILMWAGVSLKLGLAPFHTWVVSVVTQTKKMMSSIILLVQKMIPFVWVIFMYSSKLMFMVALSLMSVLWVSPQNLLQHTMKMIIILSSISHSGWLIMSCVSPYLWCFYFLTYVCIMLSLLTLMDSSLKSIFQKNNRTPLFLILLTLSGLPPFLGFYPKLFVMMEWINFKLSFLISFFLLVSMTDIFVYSRLGVLSSLLTKNFLKWLKKNHLTISTIMLSPVLVMCLFL